MLIKVILSGEFRTMDDQFEEPLIYSSDSDDCELEQHENNQETNDAIQDKGDVIEAAPPSSQSLDKRIDDILEEAEQRSSPIEDDEPIFSGKGKKSKKIISSDDDESDAATVQSDANEETKALGNDDTDEDKAPTPSPTETVEKVPVPVRSTLWDSDTSSGNERATEEPAKPAKKKVLKKKKKKKEKDSKKDPKKDKKKRIVEREGSGSESSDASGSEKREKNSESDGESSQSSSDTDEETTADDNVPVRPREKPKPRVSAEPQLAYSNGPFDRFICAFCFNFLHRCRPKLLQSRLEKFKVNRNVLPVKFTSSKHSLS